mmetsp:Transcript_24/g.67  ORF Transcript_24/g.67 Transcript_24/m.67 type:complete len:963 (-) Transcript_24:145-3033(-)|eukprot:CAMPEP_0117658376 /NCGR_PEP_ID=MMETSP0804-20121206/5832_1 /TAXON_ID=1074897 /ORGANISM="Tetraselmis astigmatica, Strain CCMP880" /LENGTH=962 /DNA_ID=CAMNT_0005464895 /DNA_START=258 /DNA_END=3146 /DNA_ORIENTATION=-
MSIPGWKNFSFFDKEGPVPGSNHEIPLGTTCCMSGDGEIVFGCGDGTIHTVDRALKCTRSWTGHTGRVAAIQVVPGHHLVATVGDEEAGTAATTLKLWDLNRVKPTTGMPELVRGVKLFQKGADAAEVTQLAISFQPSSVQASGIGGASSASPSGTTTAAVGLVDGTVLLVRGDMNRDRLQRGRLKMAAPGSSPGACAGLELTSHAPDGTGEMRLFAVTERCTTSVKVADVFQSPGQKTPVVPVVLEEDGVAGDDCCCLSPQGELVVGRTQAVYFYHAEGRGACFVFQGEKKHLKYLRHYLVVASGPAAAASKGLAAGIGAGPTSNQLVLHIQDLRNKLCAAKVEVPPVRHLAVEWGVVTAVLEDGSVLQLKERDLSQKMALLFRKNMYTVALQLAEADQAEASVVADIQRKYGDHLYAKNDYDAAIAAYVETVGFLEPSYVIRRFLDVQRIHNLTRYLEELHSARQANADHTTLLLNCYTKLKDISKLDAFISLNSTEDGEEPKFDTETAVRVCRAAGFYEHALHVALQANEPNWYLDVLVEDCSNYDEALVYIASLPRSQASEMLQKYGKTLVNHMPEQTTALLMKLCTPAHSNMNLPGVFVEEEAESVATFAHLYADRPLALMLLCEFILNSSQGGQRLDSEMLLYHTLMDLYLAKELKDTRGPGSEGPPPASSSPDSSSGAQQRREKALGLLRSGWPPGEEPRYDPEHMLVLCRMHSFQEGLIFIYEQKRLYREVLEIYMAEEDHSGLIDACIRLGDAAQGGDPQLWTEVLAYFAERPGEECTAQLKEVLEYIEAGNLLPPLVVLQTLAKNPALKMGIVKDYIGRQLTHSNSSIQSDRENIAKYQAETQRMREEVDELQSKARVYQASKCALTGAPLELPAVHFLCGHSFSLKSLGENDAECPLCAPQHRTVLDIRRSMRAGANEQDKFFTALRSSADGFSVIAEFFGRGLVSAASHQ